MIYEYEEEENITDIKNMMCFYCNEELIVDESLYHICSNDNIQNEEEAEDITTNTEAEDITTNTTFYDNLEYYLKKQLEGDNIYPNIQDTINFINNLDVINLDVINLDNENNINTIDNTIGYNEDINIINNTAGYDTDLSINNINYPMPIFEIPDNLRGHRGLPTISINNRQTKTDILYYDNYIYWCEILKLNKKEECNICMTKKNKFHKFKACAHKLCDSCCFTWFQENISCPICRSDIRDIDSKTTILTSGTKKILLF